MSRYTWITGSQIESIRSAAKRTQISIDTMETKHADALRDYDRKRQANEKHREQYEADQKLPEDQRKGVRYNSPFPNLSRPYLDEKRLKGLYLDLQNFADIQEAFAESRHGKVTE